MALVIRFADGKHTVFSGKANIPPSTFQGYLDGRMPSAEHLLRIRETYGINIDWILAGEGEMYLAKTSASETSNPNFDLIGDIIESLETIIQEEGTNLPPTKKRRLIELLYKYFRKTGEKADKGVIKEHLRLIAA